MNVNFLILILFILIVYNFRKNNEQFNLPKDKLKVNKSHGLASILRSSNTILVAADINDDHMDKLPLPESVKDEFTEWIDKGFISVVKDQMFCGGCWAFAVCATLTDRLVIATNKKWDPPFGLSEQVLISCGEEMDFKNYFGCEGGIPQFAIEGLNIEGVPIDHPCLECHGTVEDKSNSSSRDSGVVNPNVSGCSNGGIVASTIHSWWQNGCDTNASCSISNGVSACKCSVIKDKITSVKDFEPEIEYEKYRKYKTVGEAHSYTSQGPGAERKTLDLWPDIPQNIIKENIIRMKKAIYYEGPITVAYSVSSDFHDFWKNVTSDNYYKYNGSGTMLGGHAVCIVGWKKTTDGTPVWIIKNSWGENGGYGFPNGATTIDPISGKDIPKYLGGFYNHIMGINDSFVESNSCGAHPDLHVPDIKRLLPNKGKDIPKEYFKTMTIREIYLQNNGISPSSIDTEKPTKKQSIIDTTKYNIIILTPMTITQKIISDFFSNSNNYYIIASNDEEIINKIIKLLPNKILSYSEFLKFTNDLIENIKGYIVVGVKGDFNNYYYTFGNPITWKTNFKNTITNKSATLKKFSSDLESNIQGMLISSPIAFVSSKNENFFI